MQSVILAGGKGIKLRPLTIHTPKPVVPIANRPFLNYQLDLLRQASVTDITLSLSYQPGKIEELFADGGDFGVRIHYTVEAAPLGTAGAYKNAEEHLKETAIVLNGDVFTDLDLAAVIAFHRERKAAATLVVVEAESVDDFGVIEADEDGVIKRFIEKPEPGATEARTINAGCYILEPHILNYVPKGETYSFERQLFPALLAAGESLYSFHWRGYWMDIGTPQRYLRANHDLLNGKVRRHKLARPQLPAFNGDGDAPKVDKLSYIDPSCVIKAGVEINNCVIGSNCIIEDRAKLEDCVVWAGSRIGTASVIRKSFIGRSGIVGRSCTVEGAVLGDKTSLTDYTII